MSRPGRCERCAPGEGKSFLKDIKIHAATLKFAHDLPISSL